MGQQDILDILEKHKGQRLTEKDIRSELGVSCCNKPLRKLRKFGFVNENIIKINPNNIDCRVYWIE